MEVALEMQPCCGNQTGIGVYTCQLAKRLIPSDGIAYRGNVFDFMGRNHSISMQDTFPFPIVENRLLPYGVYRRIWNGLPFNYGQLFGGDADVTHFFNFVVPPKIRGAVISTIHDMTYIRYPETVAKRNLHRLQAGMAYTIERSDMIVTVSEFSKMEIMELCNVPERSIVVIPSAATPERFTCDREGLFNRLGITKPYILFVGTLEPRKNLVRLLKAFDHLSEKHHGNIQLVLCGGMGWKNEEILKTLKEIKHKANVILSGYLSTIERNTLYANAAVFAFVSIYEGFGTPLLEAMFWGIPIVSANTASMPEVAGSAACYVDPFSVDSIENGLCHVIEDSAYAASLVACGQQRFQCFSWDKSAEKLKNLYKLFL